MTKPAISRVPFPADIQALTGLRLFLALGVVAFHYQLAWTPPIELAGLMNRSRLSVDIFFMLSGFILSHVYLQGGKLDYRRFLLARVARIYPLHLFILCGMLAMVVGASFVGVGLEPGRFNLPDFFSTLFLTHAWFPSQSMNLWNGPSWSLSAEWFAYLTFPVFAWVGLRLKNRPLTILALSAVLFVALDWFHVSTMGTMLPRSEGNMGILRIIPEFLGGIGLYFLGQNLNPSRKIAVGFATISTAVLLVAMQIPLDDRVIVLSGAPFLLSIALLSKSGQNSFLSHPVSRFGGQISFALYLCHVPVLMVWRNVAQAVFNLSHDYRMGTLEVGGLLASSLVVAALLHICVERPANTLMRKVGHDLKSSRRDPAGHPV